MLHEQYRPEDWRSFIGNPKEIARIRRVIDGPSGTGKTTLAHIIADHVGANDFDVEEMDGDACGVDAVRDLSRRIVLRPMFGDYKAVIVNEAHAMTGRAVQAWLTLLERLPENVLVIFTTTQGRQADLFGDFNDPLMSRCLHVSLSSYGLKTAFAKRAQEIAIAEGLDGQPIAKYERLTSDLRNNFRAVLTAIQGGEMIA